MTIKQKFRRLKNKTKRKLGMKTPLGVVRFKPVVKSTSAPVLQWWKILLLISVAAGALYLQYRG